MDNLFLCLINTTSGTTLLKSMIITGYLEMTNIVLISCNPLNCSRSSILIYFKSSEKCDFNVPSSFKQHQALPGTLLKEIVDFSNLVQIPPTLSITNLIIQISGRSWCYQREIYDFPHDSNFNKRYMIST